MKATHLVAVAIWALLWLHSSAGDAAFVENSNQASLSDAEYHVSPSSAMHSQLLQILEATTAESTGTSGGSESGASSRKAEEGGGGGGGGGHEATIFTLQPEQIDVEFVAWCMMGFIVFTIVFEIFLHKLEHHIKNHIHYMKILNKVYKELMILGFISFILLFLTELIHIPPDKKVLLELVHVWIFFTAILFVCHALVFMRITSVVKRKWDLASGMDRHTLISKLQDASTTVYARYPRLRPIWIEPEVVEEVEFHAVKELFIKTYGLEASFDFAKYLRKSTTHAIVEHLEVKVSTWGILVVALAIFAAYMRAQNRNLESDASLNETSMWVLFSISWVILLLGTLIYILSVYSRYRLRELCQVNVFETLKTVVEKLYPSADPCHPNRSRHIRSKSLMKTLGIIASTEEEEKEHHKEYASNMFPHLFWGGTPNRLLTALDILFLCQCFFFALVIIMTSQQAFYFFNDGEAAVYVILTVVPQLLTMLWVKPMILKNFVFVHAVARVHKRTLDHTLDWMEQTYALKREFASRIQELAIGQGKNLHSIFKEIDSSRDGRISMSELRIGLKSFGLHLTMLQVSRLMRTIDPDQSGTLEWHEFSKLATWDSRSPLYEDNHAHPPSPMMAHVIPEEDPIELKEEEKDKHNENGTNEIPVCENEKASDVPLPVVVQAVPTPRSFEGRPQQGSFSSRHRVHTTPLAPQPQIANSHQHDGGEIIISEAPLEEELISVHSHGNEESSSSPAPNSLQSSPNMKTNRIAKMKDDEEDSVNVVVIRSDVSNTDNNTNSDVRTSSDINDVNTSTHLLGAQHPDSSKSSEDNNSL